MLHLLYIIARTSPKLFNMCRSISGWEMKFTRPSFICVLAVVSFYPFSCFYKCIWPSSFCAVCRAWSISRNLIYCENVLINTKCMENRLKPMRNRTWTLKKHNPYNIPGISFSRYKSYLTLFNSLRLVFFLFSLNCRNLSRKNAIHQKSPHTWQAIFSLWPNTNAVSGRWTSLTIIRHKYHGIYQRRSEKKIVASHWWYKLLVFVWLWWLWCCVCESRVVSATRAASQLKFSFSMTASHVRHYIHVHTHIRTTRIWLMLVRFYQML